MGQRGPKPTPPALKLIAGNPGKRPIDLDAGVNPPVAVPAAPAFLNKPGRAEWKRITGELEPLGLVTQLDRAKLANYCHAFGRLVEVATRIKELQAKAAAEGTDILAALVQRSPNGYDQVSALQILEARYMEAVHKYGADFGLSPADRARVTPSAAQAELPGMPAAPTAPRLGDFRPKTAA